MINRVLGTVVGLVAAAGLCACTNPSGKSWAITYELSGKAPGETVTELTYAESNDRYQDEVSDHRLTGPLGLPWKLEVIVSAGRDAAVTATPAGQAVLSCRVLLDGKKELAKATSPGPGQPVKCSKTTDT
ncbi:hypothetical protein [Amycolatopsis sp. CA-230715]|uniref:hypothetical protein n=1 Tax=Amycolatopsis sp. CA-230715 TaxID=2745196 RepID=UPI001C011FC9|nr:hypothetical protein [Amycolatopsis sp. CA-230715]QWF77769.1 hypothetical protein HUW46_01161 [Amycolatopsis sp. CA-230715]